MVEACVIDSMTRRAVQLYLAQSIALYVAHGRGEMEIKALLMLLLGFVSVSSQDSPCIEGRPIQQGAVVLVWFSNY